MGGSHIIKLNGTVIIMFELVKIYVRTGRKWETISADGLAVGDLLDGYRETRLIILGSGVPITTVDLKTLCIGIPAEESTMGIVAWLGLLQSIPRDAVVNHRRLTELGKMRVSNVSNYAVSVGIGDGSHGDGGSVAIASGADIIMRNTSDDDVTSYLQENCLFCINGYVLTSTLVGDNLVIDLGAPFAWANSPRPYTVDIIDLSELGSWEWVPFADCALTRQPDMDADRILNHSRVHVNIPNLHEYTPIVILDGMPHFLDGTYDVVSKDTLEITLDHTRVTANVMNYPISRNLTGNKTSGFVSYDFDPIMYMGVPQSGMLLIKNTDINLDITHLGGTGIPGMYTTGAPTDGLLIDTRGRPHSYQYGLSNGYIWGVTCNLGYRKGDLMEGQFGVTYRGHVPVDDKHPRLEDARLLNLYTLTSV